MSPEEIEERFLSTYLDRKNDIYTQKLVERIKQKDLDFLRVLLNSMQTFDEYEMNRAMFRAPVQAAWSKNKNVVVELLIKILSENNYLK